MIMTEKGAIPLKAKRPTGTNSVISVSVTTRYADINRRMMSGGQSARNRAMAIRGTSWRVPVTATQNCPLQ